MFILGILYIVSLAEYFGRIILEIIFEHIERDLDFEIELLMRRPLIEMST